MTAMERDLVAQGYSRDHAAYLAGLCAPTPAPPLAPLPPEPAAPPSNAEIRDWAADAGIPCPARGKIPDLVKGAYARAHGGPADG